MITTLALACDHSPPSPVVLWIGAGIAVALVIVIVGAALLMIFGGDNDV